MTNSLSKLLLALCLLTLISCTPPSAPTEVTTKKKENAVELPNEPETTTAIGTGKDGMQDINLPNIGRISGLQENGKREGLWTSYFENGKVRSTSVYVNGLRNGPNEVYFEDGTLYYKGQFKDNVRVGEWIFNEPSGKLLQKVTFDEKGNEVK